MWLFVPLRIANFAGLRLDQHLLRREGRGERSWAVHVPAAMVKNTIDLDYELPAPIARLLELYLERFRPRLVAGINPWLFPGRDGKAKHVATLREQVTRAVLQGTGIELHPHLFRHIAGKLLLDQHPGDQGTVAAHAWPQVDPDDHGDLYRGGDQGCHSSLRRGGARSPRAGTEPGGGGAVTRQTGRLSLDVADWPARDRAAWIAARQPAGPLDDGGLAARWSQKTIRQTEKGYGLWLGCLARHALLDPDAAPGARLTRETLSLFGKELLARVAPQTAASRVRDLSVMIRVLEPDADRSLVMRMQANLARRAPPSRAKRERMIAPSLLFAAGLARMDRVEREQHRKLDVRNVRYRDGMMIAILTARAFRRGNLAQMRVGRHISKIDGVYVCSFTAAETKNRRELVEPLPAALTRHIDHYLAEVRPALLRGHASDAFWVSTYRGPLSEQSIYTKICAATEEELGVKLSPHLFRDALATGIATDDPEHIRMASRLLGHADPRTTERHYIHAQALIASRRYNGVVLPIRDAAVAAFSDQEDF
jgi:integrase/recombinase XerD